VELINTILGKMSDVFKPQFKFIPVLLTTVMLMRGNVSFRNMSRYSTVCEKTFSRQFGNPSDSAVFNMIGTEMYVTPQTLMIAATDSSFIPESGNGTCGPGRFYNGSRSQTGKGLEISQPAVAVCRHLSAIRLLTDIMPERNLQTA